MHAETPNEHRWVIGDQFGLAFPADPAALRSGGARFLTERIQVSSNGIEC